jgi:hypothetical protein
MIDVEYGFVTDYGKNNKLSAHWSRTLLTTSKIRLQPYL